MPDLTIYFSSGPEHFLISSFCFQFILSQPSRQYSVYWVADDYLDSVQMFWYDLWNIVKMRTCLNLSKNRIQAELNWYNFGQSARKGVQRQHIAFYFEHEFGTVVTGLFQVKSHDVRLFTGLLCYAIGCGLCFFIMWRLRLLQVLHEKLHWLHLNGCSPACFRLCTSNLPAPC